jgi:hypothetical protein
MDVSKAYTEATRTHAPQATICYDPFYGDVRIMPMWGGSRLVTAVTAPVRSA